MLRFAGIPYPIEKTPTGYFPRQSGVRQIVSDVLQLLLTNPGERVMLPEFGTPLKRLFFDQNDEVVVEQARQMIIQSLARWEPRVEVTQLNVAVGNEDDKQVSEDFDKVLTIQIKFVDPENISEVQALDLAVPLSRSAGN